MNQSKINLRSGSLFPWHFQFMAAIILIIGLALILERTLVASVLILAGGFILTGSSGVEIDKVQKTYREYTSFFLIRRGKKKKYQDVEKLFINSSKTTTQMSSAKANHTTTFINQEFNGYLKFSDGQKLFLLSTRKKEKLETVLSSVSNFLQVPIQDTTLLKS